MWNQASWSQTLKNSSGHEYYCTVLYRGGDSRLHECLSGYATYASLNDSDRADRDICPDLSEVVTQCNMKDKNWQKMSFSKYKNVLFETGNDPFCPF